MNADTGNKIQLASEKLLEALLTLMELDWPLESDDQVRARSRTSMYLAANGSVRTLDYLDEIAARVRRHRPRLPIGPVLAAPWLVEHTEVLTVDPEELEEQ